MVSLRKILGKGSILTPIVAGAGVEYVMKTVAFNTGLEEGVEFKLPSPREKIVEEAGKWIGQPHVIAGVVTAVISRYMIKGETGRTASNAIAGYLSGKFVSENFGVSRSPFKTSPNSPPLYEKDRKDNEYFGRIV